MARKPSRLYLCKYFYTITSFERNNNSNNIKCHAVKILHFHDEDNLGDLQFYSIV